MVLSLLTMYPSLVQVMSTSANPTTTPAIVTVTSPATNIAAPAATPLVPAATTAAPIPTMSSDSTCTLSRYSHLPLLTKENHQKWQVAVKAYLMPYNHICVLMHTRAQPVH